MAKACLTVKLTR